MEKHRKDLVAGCCLCCISAVYYILSKDIKIFTNVGATPISARDMPVVWAACLAFLSILLAVRGARGIIQCKKTGEQMPPINAAAWLKDNYAVIGTFAALFIYTLCWKKIGYLLTTLIYLIVQIQLLTDKEKRGKKNIAITLVLSVLFTFVSYYVFVKLLSVQLPRGIWAF